MHLEEVQQLNGERWEEGHVSELEEKKGIMGAIVGNGIALGVLAVNGAVLAWMKLADVKDSVAIMVGIVTMICTIWMTIHNTRNPKK